MADIVINIRALDLTGAAVKSAQRNLARLTTQSKVSIASKDVQDAFKGLVVGAERYHRLTLKQLQERAQRYQQSVRTIEAMETRLKAHLLKNITERDQYESRLRLRRITVHAQALRRETDQIRAELRKREALERQVVKNQERAVRDAARVARQAQREEENFYRTRARVRATINRNVERELLAETRRAASTQARADEQLYRNRAKIRVTINRNTLRQIEAEERASQRRRDALANRIRKVREDVFHAGRRMGFNAIFAGTNFGSQASMMGQAFGGALGGLGGSLASGITGIGSILPKMTQIATRAVSVAVRAVGSVASLALTAWTGLYGSIFALLPKVGILITGLVTMAGSAISGAIRGITDIASGAVELVGGALEGIIRTASSIAETVLGAVSSVISTVMGAISSVVGKIGGIVGDAFGKILEVGTSVFESMIQKNMQLGKVMADVFGQVPEYAGAGFKTLEESVNSIAKKLPIAREQLAKGLFEIVSTQLTKSPVEATQVLEGVAKATVAGGSEADVFSVAKAATSVLQAFKIKADETEVTMSKMFKAAADGRFTFQDMAEGIQNVAGIAANFGESLDDLLASYVLTSQTMAKQTVPVALKNLILALAAPTPEAAKAMDKLGLSFMELSAEEKEKLDSGAKMISQLETTITQFERMEKKTHNQKLALSDMKKVLKSAREEYRDLQRGSGTFIGVIPSVERIQKLDLSPAQERQIVPERRALAALQSMKAVGEQATSTFKGIAEDNGKQLKVALDLQMDTLTNRVKLMGNNFEALFTELYKTVEPAMKNIVSHITIKLQDLGKVINTAVGGTNTDFLANIESVFKYMVDKAFEAATWIIQNWDTITAAIQTAWGKVEIVANAAFNMAKMASEAIMQLFGADPSKKLSEALSDLRQAAEDVWNAVVKISQGNMEPILGLIGRIKIMWADLVDYMRSSLADVLEGVTPFINKMANEAHNAIIMAKSPMTPAAMALGFGTPKDTAERYRQDKGQAMWALGDQSDFALAMARMLNPSGSAAVGRQQIGTGPFSARGIVYGKEDEPVLAVLREIREALEAKILAGGLTSVFGPGANTFNSILQDTLRNKGFGSKNDVRMFGGSDSMDLVSGLSEYLEKNVFDPASRAHQASGALGTYYGVADEDKDTIFTKPLIDVKDAVDALRVPTAEGVRQQVEIEKHTRETAAKTREQADMMRRFLQLLFGKGAVPELGPTGEVGAGGAPGPAGPGLGVFAKKPKQKQFDDDDTVDFTRPPMSAEEKNAQAKENSENLQEIAENTEEMTDSGNGITVAPSISDYEPLQFGKLPPLKTGGLTGINEALAAAQSVAHERPSGRVKKPKKQRSDKFMSDDDVQFDHNELVRARKFAARGSLNRALHPFGDPYKGGTFGFNRGLAGRTVGKPIVDPETGELSGFTGGIQSPFGGRVNVKQPMSQNEHKAAWLEFKANKAAEAKARADARAAKKDAWQKKHKLGKYKPEPKPFGKGVKPGVMRYEGAAPSVSDLTQVDPSHMGKTGTEGGESANTEGVVKSTDEAKEAVQANSEAVRKLYDALQSLSQIQQDAADGVTELTDTQVENIAKVAEIVTGAVEAIVAGQKAQTDVLADFMKKINDKLSELEGLQAKLEAAAGI